MFLTFREVLPDSVLFVASSKLSFLCCNFFIISHLSDFVKYINCELKSLSVQLSCSTSQRNAYNLFFALSRLKLPLSFLPFRFAAPCSLHRCSSAFRFRFTYTFVFLNLAFPRATALLLYHDFSRLSSRESSIFLIFFCRNCIFSAFLP